MIKSRQIAKALYDLSENKTENLSDKFLDFMKKTKLVAQIPAVLYHLDKIMETEREKRGVSIKSAHELKRNTIKEIKKFLQAENVDEILKVDKSLIAGFTAKWQGRFYDMSFVTGIKKLEENIL